MRILRKITDELWWDVATKCEYATFYHTPIWRDIAEHAYPGYRDETFGAILDSGVRVVFPLISTRRLGPFRWLISAFEGCYGGFIADGPVLPDEAAQIYRHACALPTCALFITDNPLGQMMPDALKSTFRLIVREPDYVLNLKTDFDSLFTSFSTSMRRHYRSGIKKGVTVRLATTLDDYRAFHACYRDAVDRWGEGESYGYSWERIKQLYEMSQRFPEHVRVWLMIVDEQIVGGRAIFYWGRQATLWGGAAHRDFLNHHVTPVADIEVIRDAIDRKYELFDFNTADQMQGVRTYKLRFEPTQVPIGAWYYEYPPIIALRALYKDIRHRLFNRRPQPEAGPATEPAAEQAPLEANVAVEE